DGADNKSAAREPRGAVQEPVPGKPPPRKPVIEHDAIGARVTLVPDAAIGPGPKGLVDGKLADGDEAASTGWVGWERGAGPVQVTLDLKKPTKVTKLGAHFLRASNVALPTQVQF